MLFCHSSMSQMAKLFFHTTRFRTARLSSIVNNHSLKSVYHNWVFRTATLSFVGRNSTHQMAKLAWVDQDWRVLRLHSSQDCFSICSKGFLARAMRFCWRVFDKRLIVCWCAHKYTNACHLINYFSYLIELKNSS